MRDIKLDDEKRLNFMQIRRKGINFFGYCKFKYKCESQCEFKVLGII